MSDFLMYLIVNVLLNTMFMMSINRNFSCTLSNVLFKLIHECIYLHFTAKWIEHIFLILHILVAHWYNTSILYFLTDYLTTEGFLKRIQICL